MIQYVRAVGELLGINIGVPSAIAMCAGIALLPMIRVFVNGAVTRESW